MSTRTLDKINAEITSVQFKVDNLLKPIWSGGLLASMSQQGMALQQQVFQRRRLEELKGERDAVMAYDKDFIDCIKLDKQIKLMDVDISNKRREALTASGNRVVYVKKYADTASAIRSKLQKQFVNQDCSFKIENKKAQETAGIIGNEIAKYEDDVLSGSGKQQKQLFIIGGVVLLVALGIIVYSTKRK